VNNPFAGDDSDTVVMSNSLTSVDEPYDRVEHVVPTPFDAFPAGSSAAVSQTSDLEERPAGPLRVILADDAADLRRLLIRLLSKDGRIEIVGEAADGIAAVRLCGELQPDVLVLDLSMPGSDGLNTLEAVRQHSSTAVVILSGLPRAQLEVACLERGAAAYLEKGIATASIIDAVIAAGGER